MASPFQKYQSGIEASTGNLVPAYGQIAQQTSSALAGLGQNLAEGIKNYAKNRDENDLLTAKAQGLAGNFEFLTKQIKDNPELAPFAESFNPILSKIGNFETMSKGQKQALLLEAETFQANIAPALAIFKEGNVARTRQGVQSAIDSKPQVKTKFGAVIEALPYQPDKSTEWNIQNNREYIELTKKNDSKLTSLDVDDAIKQIADGWSTAFSSDPNLAKTDPKFRDTILRGLSDWKSSFGGVTNPDPFSDAYTGATVSPAEMRMRDVTAEKLAEDRAEKLAAGKTDGKASAPVVSSTAKTPVVLLTAAQKFSQAKTDAQKSLTKDTADLQKTKDELYQVIIREGNYGEGEKNNSRYKALKEKEKALKQSIKDKESTIEGLNPESFKDDVDTRPKEEILAERAYGEEKPKTELEAKMALLSSQLINETGQKLDEAISGHKKISVKDLVRYINWEESTRNPTIKDIPGLAVADDFGWGSKGVETYTNARTNVESAAGKLGIPIDKPMSANQIADLRTELSKQKKTSETASKTAQKKLETLSPQTIKVGTTAGKPSDTPTYEDTIKRPFDYNTKIKTDVQFERDMTYAEEREYVRKWFIENRGGVIPESLDAVYKAVRPETDVKFMPAPDGGQVMITSKGAQYIAPVKPEKGMSDKEISEQTLYRYGTVQGNRIIPEERTKGSGIKLAGFAKGGEKNAEAFQKLHDDTVKARTIIPKLLAMYQKDKLGRTLIPNEMWGDAESLLAQLKAAIRVETVGTGPVALPEHQMILERIGDPRKFFALDIVGKSKLNSIMSSMENSLKNNNAGVQVTFTPTAGDADAMERQARIDANKSRR